MVLKNWGKYLRYYHCITLSSLRKTNTSSRRSTAQKNYVLDAPLVNPPAPTNLDVVNVYQTWADDYTIVQCAMLYDLEPGLQKRFEHHGPYEMFQEAKLVFRAHTWVERSDTSNNFFSCKMEENNSVSEHVKCMGVLYSLESVGR